MAQPQAHRNLRGQRQVPADERQLQIFLYLQIANAHMHGRGMVLMTAADPGFVRLCSSLAEAGMRVIGVEFSNGGGSHGLQ
jgi:hypothetical protein